MLQFNIAKILGLEAYFVRRQRAKYDASVKEKIELDEKRVAERQKTKIFVIGFNKTATTSVYYALLEFDIIVGDQRGGEWLLDDMIAKNYDPLFEYCQTAEAFQDIPFSCPEVYKILDKKFPNSKFILTLRDNPEQWFRSLTKFHAKFWGNGKDPLVKAELAKAGYVYKSYPLKAINYIYGDSYYDLEVYTNVYNKHNQEVQEYFKNRPEDLLVLNVAEEGSYKKFCNFIGETPLRETFEWKNKTSDISL